MWLFALDCHDRECLAYVVRRRPLLSGDIQSLMFLSVKKRFKSLKAPRRIQWLSDRGARCHETMNKARHLGLKSCFTAPYTPESNGMSEAFVATMKKDYIYTSDCSSAQAVMKLFKNWIEDSNNVASHSGRIGHEKSCRIQEIDGLSCLVEMGVKSNNQQLKGMISDQFQSV